MLFLKKRTIFTQGDPADAIFYLQTGKVRLTVVSKTGKEATIGILSDGSFFGEGSLAGQSLRMGTATTMTDCAVLRIEKRAMVDTLHREHTLSDLFVEKVLHIRRNRVKVSQKPKPRAGLGGEEVWGEGADATVGVSGPAPEPMLRHLLGWAASAFRSREDLILENLALRQQILALHAKRPRRRLTALHKLFWIVLRRLWSGWERPLILVTPRTVVGWHRAGFRLYWTWVSRARRVGGRRRVSKEVRALIFRMASENPTWGAPRIHGELLKLGFHLSEITVSRWLRRVPRNPDTAKRWLTFLRNHREAIAAMDFFTVPTLTFGVLYCFFVIGHDRRKILRFNVTRNPNALWIVQQMREAWPYAPAHRFLVFDRDTKFSNDVISSAIDMGSQPVRTAFRSPWQNGVAERWVGSCRRDLPDHVIVLNERHLKRLMTEYVRYYHEDRTHLGLAKETPTGRPTAICPAMGSKIHSFTRLGGLHHRYAVAS